MLMIIGKDNLFEIDLSEIIRIIGNIKAEVTRLKECSSGMQCVIRNSERIMASLAIIEINCEMAVKEEWE